jgi:O-antigen/teichoic acid export membrane protein
MLAGERGIYTIVTFVLAAILGPRDFGVIAMAMVYIGFIQMFLDQGFSLALIQRKHLQPEHLDSIFWLVMAVGGLLVALSIVLSGWWANVNHLPALAAVIRWLSLTILIGALNVVQNAVLQRNMNFRALSLQANVAAIIGGVVGIGMALASFGVWSLVGQKLVEAALYLLLLWKMSPWRPRWMFSLRHLKELLGFSASTFMAKVGVLANRDSAALLIGLFFGPVPVGLYRFAERTVEMVLDMTTTPLRQAAFPQLSKVQDNSAQLSQSMLSCIRLTAALTIPALAGLAVTSRSLMAVMGAKWTPAADALTILCVTGIILAFTRFAEVLLPALSRPHHLAILKWVECGVAVGALLLVVFLLRGASITDQVTGIALARFAVGVVLFGPVFLFFVIRLSGVSLRDFASTIGPSFFAGAAVVATVVGLSKSDLLSKLKPITILSTEVLFGATVAVAVMWMFDQRLKTEVLMLVARALGKQPTRRDKETELEHAAASWQGD